MDKKKQFSSKKWGISLKEHWPENRRIYSCSFTVRPWTCVLTCDFWPYCCLCLETCLVRPLVEGGVTDKPELLWDVLTRTLFQPIIINMWSTNYWFPSYAHIHILGTHKCRKKLCRSVEVLGRFISVKLYGWPWCDHGSLRSLQEKKAGNKNPDLEWC